ESLCNWVVIWFTLSCTWVPVGLGAAPAFAVTTHSAARTTASPPAAATPRRDRDVMPASRVFTCLPRSLAPRVLCAVNHVRSPVTDQSRLFASVVKGDARIQPF